ncbi:MAG: redoxin domain-containing protein [Halothiobacillaceae bacterium]|nr:redoxin domain-containing protein [Halothiobacillaceae bacterium]HER35475.1 redoxin domain-containing protein [Halothiobacillaceae bacterium]
MADNPEPTTERKRRLPRWARWTLEGLVFIAILLAVQAWMGPDLPEGQIPGMAVETIEGEELTLGGPSDEPTVVVFWATWCPYCDLELPWLTDMVEDHRVITVAMQSGDAATVRAHMRENDLEALPVVNDPEARIASSLGVSVTPTFLFFDRTGRVAYSTTGLTSPWGVRLRLWWLGRG